ncbi:ABC transporter ATP-binding protein [Timonella senegalensis]|jgi:ABC-type multidrug transport system fused ATPase/permease subunit|uniref:ABC transporter ATP-binding protein n=1 Tax=Timonella senegalensis TaxID=1465825 RepID=UPI00030E3521|nr:ABC transporter ATP-binding protein [Timonella senegalensis]
MTTEAQAKESNAPVVDPNLLPIADGKSVRTYSLGLVKDNRSALIKVVVMHAFAAIAGLAGPVIIGRLVDAVTAQSATTTYVNLSVAILVAAIACQSLITRFARRLSMVFGENVFAQLRENFLDTAVGLPLSVVERSGTGDLVSRTTHDINRVQHTVRFGVPQILVSAATVIITLIASFLTSPLVALAVVAGLPLLYFVGRWYLPRAPKAYIEESAAYAQIYADVTESVEGSRTIESLSLTAARRELVENGIDRAMAAERRTLNLRTVLIPGMDLSFAIAPILVLLWGAFMVSQGHASVGAVTTVLLYTTMLVGPIWDLVFWLDESQVAATSMARIIGVGQVETDRVARDVEPEHETISGSGIEYAYREGHNVLHGIDIELTPGERLAVVGPSGAGKSTLGRMLAGIHPPTGGSVTVGNVPLIDLPLEDLRGHVALVTQEHHVFVGTLAQNLLLASPDATEADLRRALGAVGALEWADKLPEGVHTEVGSGGHTLTPAQAQQIALARLVLLDPHTLILDEATSLLDPRAARDLEKSLNAVLSGRTVVAIAHRLHTAHDADRVAVVTAGQISEIGPHDELVANGGDYADLWHSWQQK